MPCDVWLRVEGVLWVCNPTPCQPCTLVIGQLNWFVLLTSNLTQNTKQGNLLPYTTLAQHLLSIQLQHFEERRHVYWTRSCWETLLSVSWLVHPCDVGLLDGRQNFLVKSGSVKKYWTWLSLDGLLMRCKWIFGYNTTIMKWTRLVLSHLSLREEPTLRGLLETKVSCRMVGQELTLMSVAGAEPVTYQW